MKRPLSIVLAQAFDRAAHDVAVSPEVHSAMGDAEPTRVELLVYWSRGLVAGFLGDHASVPHGDRIAAAFTRMRIKAVAKIKAVFFRAKSSFVKPAPGGWGDK